MKKTFREFLNLIRTDLQNASKFLNLISLRYIDKDIEKLYQKHQI